MDVLATGVWLYIPKTQTPGRSRPLSVRTRSHDVIQGADDAPILQLHDAPPPGRWSAPGCCLPRSWTLLTRSWT
jgi:hypothetical protein